VTVENLFWVRIRVWQLPVIFVIAINERLTLGYPSPASMEAIKANKSVVWNSSGVIPEGLRVRVDEKSHYGNRKKVRGADQVFRKQPPRNFSFD